MDSSLLASHVSIWFCPALSVPPLLTILTVRGGIVVATVVCGGLVEGSSVVTAAGEVIIDSTVVGGEVEGSSVVTAAGEGTYNIGRSE